MHVPTKRSFFKVILDATIREGKLSVPPKFARDYEDRFSDPVTLEAPTGEKWLVNLLKQEQRIWLEEGWKEFEDFYDLRPGNVVIFEHDGGNHSHFLVHIMDLSATEIDYPARRRNVAGDHRKRRRKNGVQAPIEPKDERVEEAVNYIFNDPHPQSCTVRKGSCSGVKMEEGEEEVIGIVGDTSPEGITEKSRRRLDVSTEGMYIKGYKPKGRAASNIIASRARKASVNFTSHYPYFKHVVEQMDLERNSVDIPYDIVKKLPAKKQTVTLEIGDRSWEVKLSKLRSINKGRLSVGWLPFARQNGLEVGDVCAFELTAATKFNVTIFPQSV